MSSGSSLRRRPTEAHGRRRTTTPHRPHHPSPSLHRHSRRRPSEVLTKSRSEPLLKIGDSGDDCSRWLFRLQTCNDVFCSTPKPLWSSDSSLGLINEGYQKDAKVVVTVTVEASPGPIRTMARLGSSVDDMIKLVIDRYAEEGRTPQLDGSSGSCYDLHLSRFSFECLDRSIAIGDIGSRSFYLRKSRGMLDDDQLEREANCPLSSSTHSINEISLGSGRLSSMYITQRMTNLVGKMHRLWKILDCFHCQ